MVTAAAVLNHILVTTSSSSPTTSTTGSNIICVSDTISTIWQRRAKPQSPKSQHRHRSLHTQFIQKDRSLPPLWHNCPIERNQPPNNQQAAHISSVDKHLKLNTLETRHCETPKSKNATQIKMGKMWFDIRYRWAKRLPGGSQEYSWTTAIPQSGINSWFTMPTMNSDSHSASKTPCSKSSI